MCTHLSRNSLNTYRSEENEHSEKILHLPFRVLWFSCCSVNQQTQMLRENHRNVLIRQHLRVWASLSHHQGVHSCIKQSVKSEHIQTNRLLQLLCTYPSTINHKLTKLRQLFNTLEMTKMLKDCFILSLMMGQ